MKIEIERLEQGLQESNTASERAVLLRSLSEALLKVDPKRSLSLVREALQLGVTRQNKELYAQCLRILACSYGAMSNFAEAFRQLERARAAAQALDDESELAATLRDTGRVYFMVGEHLQALIHTRQALDLCQPLDNGYLRGQIYSLLGNIQFQLGDSKEALECYFQTLNIIGPESRYAAIALDDIANVYSAMGDMPQSIVYSRKALAALSKQDDLHELANVSANLGSRLLMLDRASNEMTNIPEARALLLKALELFRECRSTTRQILTLLGLGSLHHYAGERDEAVRCWEECRDRAQAIAHNQYYTSALINLAAVKSSTGDEDAAIPMYEQALACAHKNGLKRYLAEIHKSLYSIYEGRAAWREAFRHLKSYQEYDRQLLGEDKQKQIAKMQIGFEVERLEHEKMLAEKENDVLKLRQQQLEESVRQKTNRVIAVALLLSQKNELLQSLQRQIRVFLEAPQGKSDLIKGVARQLRESINDEKSWDAFLNEFEQLHGDFVHSISARFPQLTPLELKLCTLLKLNLTTKDISRLLCVSIRSVEQYRYRLRRKFGLSRDDNLTVFLAAC